MGKRILCQRRGRGTSKFRVPSHRFLGEIKYPYDREFEGTVTEIKRDAIHSAPIMVVRSEEGKSIMLLAPEGIKVGDTVKITVTLKNTGEIPVERNMIEISLLTPSRVGVGGIFQQRIKIGEKENVRVKKLEF